MIVFWFILTSFVSSAITAFVMVLIYQRIVLTLKQKNIETSSEKAFLQKQLEEEKARAAEALQAERERHKQEQEQQFAYFKSQVENTTQQLLRQREEAFKASSEQQFGSLMKPLKDSMESMQRALTENREQQVANKTSFEEQIKVLLEAGQKMTASADTLSSALSGQAKTQGNWGELLLKNVLDAQGWVEGVNYDTQITLRDKQGNIIISDEGHRMIPDVIVHLDAEHDLVIDAKTSLTAFMRYQEAQTDEQKAAEAKAHLISVRQHIDELARKDYQKYLNSVGLQLMFVPVEEALQLAVHEQRDLYQYAASKNVYLVGEQNLLLAIKMITLTWRNMQQSKVQKEIVETADTLLSRVGDFMGKYKVIGDALHKALDNFEAGEKKLTAGGQSVATSVRKLKQLGVKEDPKKPLIYEEPLILPDYEETV